jgi:hypothetical protein
MLTGRVLARLLSVGVLGGVVGVVGTGIHRLAPPWGIALALLTVFAAAVLARAWAGGAGLLALALGVFAVVGLLGGPGPGGDVIVALQPVGIAWYLGALVVVLAGLLPRRWFSDVPPAHPGG